MRAIVDFFANILKKGYENKDSQSTRFRQIETSQGQSFISSDWDGCGCGGNCICD